MYIYIYIGVCIDILEHIQGSICIKSPRAFQHPHFRSVSRLFALQEFLHLCFAHWKFVYNGDAFREFGLCAKSCHRAFKVVVLDLSLLRRHG